MASSSTGFCYSDVSSGNQTHLVNNIQQSYVSDPEMFNLTTGMEMIGFSKHLQQQSTDTNAVMAKSFFSKPGQHLSPSSSKTMNESSTNFYRHHEISETSGENLIVGAAHDSVSAPWQENRLLVDDSSLRCVFPCEGNERPSQGLSLSLSSTNPSSIGLQSFELRHTTDHHVHQHQNVYQGHFVLKNSKFLVPAQDLLNEFCSLGTKQNDVPKQKSQKNKQWEEDNSSRKHCLSSLEFVELQKKKTKLLSMLEEVERRYRHYCNQMKTVVSSFEAVAGNGAATVYSCLALKAMSKHFRCLKDGILDQIQATRKAMGEKDPIAPGTTRGETPRLRVIDQALRQQRAFQQLNMMETHPWRPQRGLPERSVSVLRAWLFEHFLHPVRLWKPMVEQMYLEEEKEENNNISSSDNGGNNIHEDDDISPSMRSEDQKPTQSRLLRIDSECVSSIVNANNSDHKNDPKNIKTMHMNQQEDTFGSVDIDFSCYPQQSSSGMVSFASNDQNANNQSFHSGGGVSLTLGLQQHGGSGVSIAFPSATEFYTSRDQHMEGCQPIHHYSLLDGEGQNMPYRNLMGTQLLHDLA
ncbi:POX domain [Sesbania bispinosa]|nr:POX domain [Sesbania bispinosa]